MKEKFVLSIEVKDAVTITINLKMVNIHYSREILQQLEDVAREHEKKIILNLENVDSLDSSTITMLVEFYGYCKEIGREFMLINLNPFVKKTFEMLHLAKFFNIV
ncbi:MAG: hypothetical protein A2176_01195 [Spirochaetes bacterium RBG_13_51_14]|nr:MAG: hypothetical protein A2176_01195 [Spirochaetes bacterium RBG_13_51_14]